MRSWGPWLLFLAVAAAPSMGAHADSNTHKHKNSDIDAIAQYLDANDVKAQEVDVPDMYMPDMHMPDSTVEKMTAVQTDTTVARSSRRRKSSSRRRGSRRRKNSSRRRRKSSSRRRRKSAPSPPSRRRKGSSPSPTPAPTKAPSKEPRYSCTPSSDFKGDVFQYADGSFCKCDYGPTKCDFICGGTKPNHGGNCGPQACTEKLVEFDDKNTYIINVKVSEGGSGSPYRAFSYMKNVKVSEATTFSFTFKANNHNKVYSKLFFWGDGNNILGLKPDGTFCFMPSGDAPLSQITCKGGTSPAKDDTWYRVDLALTPPSSIELSIDKKKIGTGSIQGFSGMPMIGVYHWGGMGTDYQVRFRDMCLGFALGPY